jgi:hypothetical protein
MQVVTAYVRSILLLNLGARLDGHIMLGFFEHLLALPFRFFEQRSSGDLLMRLGSNVVIRETLTNQTLAMGIDGVLVIGYLVLLFTLEPSIGLLVLVAGILQVGVLRGARARAVTSCKGAVRQAAHQSYLVEALAGIATLKTSGGEARARPLDRSLAAQLNVTARRGPDRARRFGAPCPAPWRAAALAVVGVLKVLGGSMSLGTMFALNMLGTVVLTSLASLVSSGQAASVGQRVSRRLADVLEAEPSGAPRRERDAPAAGSYRARNVSFRYAPDTPWIFRDVSLVSNLARRWRWLDAPARARARSSSCCSGSIGRPKARFCMTGYRSKSGTIAPCASSSGWYSRSRSCSRARCVRASASTSPGCRSNASRKRLASRRSTRIGLMPMGYETPSAKLAAPSQAGAPRLSIARSCSPTCDPGCSTRRPTPTCAPTRVDQNLTPGLHACRRSSSDTVQNADQIVVLDDGQSSAARADLQALAAISPRLAS